MILCLYEAMIVNCSFALLVELMILSSDVAKDNLEVPVCS